MKKYNGINLETKSNNDNDFETFYRGVKAKNTESLDGLKTQLIPYFGYMIQIDDAIEAQKGREELPNTFGYEDMQERLNEALEARRTLVEDMMAVSNNVFEKVAKDIAKHASEEPSSKLAFDLSFIKDNKDITESEMLIILNRHKTNYFDRRTLENAISPETMFSLINSGYRLQITIDEMKEAVRNIQNETNKLITNGRECYSELVFISDDSPLNELNLQIAKFMGVDISSKFDSIKEFNESYGED